MSTTKLATVICWIVVAIVVLGLAVWLLTGSLFGINTGFKINAPAFSIGGFDNLAGPFNEAGSYQVPADGVDSIDVDWVSGAVTITPYDGDSIKLTEYARRELKDNEKLVYETSGGKLQVRYVSPGLTINMITKKLELLVPESLADKLNLLSIGTTSAELKVSDFEVKSFEVDETSGSAEISNIKANTADVHSGSGEVSITNLTASELYASTVSGRMKFDAVTADTLQTKTTSGSQQLGGTFKSVDASSVSGEVSVTSGVNPDKVTIGTTSGGITLAIPGGDGVTVSYDTTSGRFNSDISVRTGGNANYRFTSVSGDIRLKAA
ncbi:Putative adhesin [Sporobacter termitidis DSM 10068]|uniref:Putative adhesin n=1 Tax=Sporobacter termitidis DSM 10068 TaxID=1123282 RepID=A0A1M5UMZ3_9FIRM|nr:DUF4097 family beta strand repeat-containing protein [Sporobacter termitidis]SHH64317.1 Putative adhesin [Sporobacter termitidis DSM 10068]